MAFLLNFTVLNFKAISYWKIISAAKLYFLTLTILTSSVKKGLFIKCTLLLPLIFPILSLQFYKRLRNVKCLLRILAKDIMTVYETCKN